MKTIDGALPRFGSAPKRGHECDHLKRLQSGLSSWPTVIQRNRCHSARLPFTDKLLVSGIMEKHET